MIYTIYSTLKEYNEEYANKFVLKLQTLISTIQEDLQPLGEKPKKIDTFNYGLALINVNLTPDEAAGVPAVGGNRKIRRGLGGSETMVITKPSEIQTNVPKRLILTLKSEESKDIFFKGLQTELSDIINHLKFMKTLYYLQHFSNRLSDKNFELLGLKAYDNFFRSVFGSNYGVLPKEFVLRAAQQRQGKMVGGEEKNIEEIVRISRESSKTKTPETMEEEERRLAELKVFEDAKFLSTYSVIPYYEYVANTLEDRLEIFESIKRKSANIKMTIEGIKSQLREIREFISTIRGFDNLDIEDIPAMAGGRRLRKFKTYKKNKKPMKKTLKRRRN